MRPARDTELVQIVNASLADATERARTAEGGSWLACHAGCTPCCHGVFRISPLDADRLHAGLSALQESAPERAASIQHRAAALVATLQDSFPGNAITGTLDPEDEAWDSFADLPATDAACPVLDPASGKCELYEARPLTCRVFGPPVLNEGGIGMCELCYQGATETEVLEGEMYLHHHALEEELNRSYAHGDTLIAWALRSGFSAD